MNPAKNLYTHVTWPLEHQQKASLQEICGKALQTNDGIITPFTYQEVCTVDMCVRNY